jgi:hypothetical protein
MTTSLSKLKIKNDKNEKKAKKTDKTKLKVVGMLPVSYGTELEPYVYGDYGDYEVFGIEIPLHWH